MTEFFKFFLIFALCLFTITTPSAQSEPESNSRQLVFDITGTLHGFGDVTGPLWTAISLKSNKEYEKDTFTLILDQRSEQVVSKLYNETNMAKLERGLGVKIISPSHLQTIPTADYLFQLFFGGRYIADLEKHPAADSKTTVIISDTMHGSSLDEIRKGNQSFFFNPPGIGRDRSGLVLNPELKVEKTDKTAKRQLIHLHLQNNEDQSFSSLSPLFNTAHPFHPNVRFSFLYGVHNELRHGIGQTESYIRGIQDQNKQAGPVIIFSANTKDEIISSIGHDFPNVSILSTKDLAKNLPLKNQVYILPLGNISNELFTQLMEVSDFPVLIEGNSAMSHAIISELPFLLYRSPWNLPQTKQFLTLYNEHGCNLDPFYDTRIPDLKAALDQAINWYDHAAASTEQVGSPTTVARSTPEFSAKLIRVMKLTDQAEKLRTNPLSTLVERERSYLELTNQAWTDTHDHFLAFSIFRESHRLGLISDEFFQVNLGTLSHRFGATISDIESRLIPNQPNSSFKLEDLGHIVQVHRNPLSYSRVAVRPQKTVSLSASVKSDWDRIKLNLPTPRKHRTSQEGILIAHPVGGLGNRMMFLASARALASRSGRKLVVEWSIDEHVPASFQELFSIPHLETEIKLPGSEKLIAIKDLKSALTTRQDTSYYRPGSTRENEIEKIERDNHPIVYLEYWRSMIPKTDDLREFIQEYLGSYKELLPSAEIMTAVTDFYQRKFEKQDVIGVHFRSWNKNVENEFWQQQNLAKPPIELFINEMERVIKENPRSLFYIAGDDIQAINSLEKRFPGKILRYIHEQVTRQNAEDAKRAMIDWFLLQRTRYIIGTRQSTFSDEASLFTAEHRKVELGPIVFDMEKTPTWENISGLVQGSYLTVLKSTQSADQVDCTKFHEFPMLIWIGADDYLICNNESEPPHLISDPADRKRLSLELSHNGFVHGHRTIVNVYVRDILKKYHIDLKSVEGLFTQSLEVKR